MSEQNNDFAISGLPLNQFTQKTPPGWRPGVPRYPLRLYEQLLKLWWRQTDVSEAQSGPLMAGRLRGTAFQLALKITQDRFDPDTGQIRQFTGDELLAQGPLVAEA